MERMAGLNAGFTMVSYSFQVYGLAGITMVPGNF